MPTEQPHQPRPIHQHSACPYNCPASVEITTIRDDVRAIREAIMGDDPLRGYAHDSLLGRTTALESNVRDLQEQQKSCNRTRKNMVRAAWSMGAGVAGLIGTTIWQHLTSGTHGK